MTIAGRSGSQHPVLVLFRDDLRIIDNPALLAASAAGQPVACAFILDEVSPRIRSLGGAARWWLHGAVQELSSDLSKMGTTLHLMVGAQQACVTQLVEAIDPSAVYWNRRYGEAERAVDGALKAMLKDRGIEAKSFNGHLLYEPWEVESQAGGSLKVYSPFWRAAQRLREPPAPEPAPRALRPFEWPSTGKSGGLQLADLELLPTKPDWAGGMRDAWMPGEAGARATLEGFLATGLDGYGEDRNRPDIASTSRLSPYLRFGQISPRSVWHAAEAARTGGRSKATARDLEVFHKELGWREFSYHLLYHFPDLPKANFQQKFDAFPWRDDDASLRAWQRGLTGYPLVDAGMRQLWQTGWMHNRVRMVVASFLIKHLLIDWRRGEEWFWDTLVDADAANNAASWQWVAGSGADAAPYYRIFNPVLQGEKFDPQGNYVRAFVPELARLPASVIHRPWEASPQELAQAGVRLGEDYPLPIVDHAAARDRALSALQSIGERAA